jgi:hypothetical protein
VCEAFGFSSAVAFCDAVALSRLAAAVPSLIESSSAQARLFPGSVSSNWLFFPCCPAFRDRMRALIGAFDELCF